MKHEQDLSDEDIASLAANGADMWQRIMAREIQRRRARDAGDAAARALADAVVACVHDSVYGRWFTSMDRPEVRAYRVALAAERKAERPSLRECFRVVTCADGCKHYAEPWLVEHYMDFLRAYRRDHGSVDEALEREG